jgi:hypothetical protein
MVGWLCCFGPEERQNKVVRESMMGGALHLMVIGEAERE